MPPRPLKLLLGGRTEQPLPCSPKQLTQPRLHCADQVRNSPSDHHPPLTGNGSSCHQLQTKLHQPRTVSLRTADDATHMDTSSPALPATPKTRRKTAADFQRPASQLPMPLHPVRLTANSTATSTATTTTRKKATPLQATPQHSRINSGGGTAGGTSEACYRWWTWNSSLGGDAARDDRLAGDAFIAGDSDRFSRVHLYYGRGSFMTRVWGSTTPNSPSWRALPLPRAALETAKHATCVRARRSDKVGRPAGTLSVSLIPTCVAYIRKR